MINNREDIHVDALDGPFPHLIIKNIYNEQELDLIWEELNFYTKPNKLLEAEYHKVRYFADIHHVVVLLL